MTVKNAFSLWDISGDVADYEEGKLSEAETHAMFEKLIETGIIYHLQGSYQREAIALGYKL